MLGYFIIQLHTGIAAKFALLLPIAVASTMIVYHVGVRPVPILRALFGMRPQQTGSRATAGALPA